jgi:hypothetical protein
MIQRQQGLQEQYNHKGLDKLQIIDQARQLAARRTMFRQQEEFDDNDDRLKRRI